MAESFNIKQEPLDIKIEPLLVSVCGDDIREDRCEAACSNIEEVKMEDTIDDDNVSENCSDNDISTPEEIKNAAREITLNLLPAKSKEKYSVQYRLFMDWCKTKQVKKYSENVILTYLSELSQKYKSSTLWTVYSMLKASLAINNDIDIGKFSKLTAFLKRKSIGFIPKKSTTLNRIEINKFITEAPDDTYLMTKVALIIGLAGACKCEELTNLTVDDIVDKDDMLIITIKNPKTNGDRVFSICNTQNEMDMNVLFICRKYFELRPKDMTSRRLFIKYSAGKCAAQNVGKHKIGSLPSLIAKYLNLPKPEEYTGHCYRRSSATLLADSGADLLEVKKRRGLKSGTDIDNSMQNKISVAEKIFGGKKTTEYLSEKDEIVTDLAKTDDLDVKSVPSCSNNIASDNSINLSSQGISISGCTNCTFNFNM